MSFHDPAKLQNSWASLCPFFKRWRGQFSWSRVWGALKRTGSRRACAQAQSRPTALLANYGEKSKLSEVCFGSGETLSARMPISNIFYLQPAISLWHLGENGLSWELSTTPLPEQLCWWRFRASASDPVQNTKRMRRKLGNDVEELLGLGKGYSYWKSTSICLSVHPSLCAPVPGAEVHTEGLGSASSSAPAVSAKRALPAPGRRGGQEGASHQGPGEPAVCRTEPQTCALATGLDTFVFPHKYN